MSILLHPKLGVNPRLTFCPRCGGETNELLLVGKANKLCRCRHCKMTMLGPPWPAICPKCRNYPGWEKIRELDEWEKLPSSKVCDECQKEQEQFAQVVKEGGIYFRCKCGVEGVVKAGAPLALAIREHANIQPPDPIGVEVETCPKCKPEGDQDGQDERAASRDNPSPS